MNAIGGYFELELPNYSEYHQDAVHLNSGRNALEYILLANSYRKVYIPYFTCDVILEPLQRTNTFYEFYEINQNLEPSFDFSKIDSDEAFLYTNYFGIKDTYTIDLINRVPNLIIDNAQSFYSKPIKDANTFYSPRKFFGLPDGGLVYCTKEIVVAETDTKSTERISHLIKRLAFNAEIGYKDFSKNDSSLQDAPLQKMSKLTSRLLKSIDYETAKKLRLSNFNFLHEHLKDFNLFPINKPDTQVPMVYPFRTKNTMLRKKLTENRIYTAKYWPNVSAWSNHKSIEQELVEEFVHLPVDQRYNHNDLKRIVKIILNYA